MLRAYELLTDLSSESRGHFLRSRCAGGAHNPERGPLRVGGLQGLSVRIGGLQRHVWAASYINLATVLHLRLMLKLLHSCLLMIVYVLWLQQNLFTALSCLLEYGILNLLMMIMLYLMMGRKNWSTSVTSSADPHTHGQAITELARCRRLLVVPNLVNEARLALLSHRTLVSDNVHLTICH